MSDLCIRLPEDKDNSFHISRLIRHLISVGRDYIIQGQQHVALSDHTKQSSLDYWIRETIANRKDTAQATNNVLEQLCNTDLFSPSENLECPDNNEKCKGIRIVET